MFGRRRKRGRQHDQFDQRSEIDAEFDADERFDEDVTGPFDEADAPDDGVSRLDLGSVRLMDPAGAVRAVHLITPGGQLTVNAFAAPRSGGLWKEVSQELTTQLTSDGARVNRETGEWGPELVALTQGVTVRFIGVDGPRWMLRAVGAGPQEHADAVATALRDLVRGTVVVRGGHPLPVRTPLPIELPEKIARHISQAQAGQQQA